MGRRSVPGARNLGARVPKKAKFRELECNEDELVDIPDHWIPLRPEHDEYATPLRKTCTLNVLERSWALRGCARRIARPVSS